MWMPANLVFIQKLALIVVFLIMCAYFSEAESVSVPG